MNTDLQLILHNVTIMLRISLIPSDMNTDRYYNSAMYKYDSCGYEYWRNVHIQYTYIVGKYNIYLYEL